MRRLPRTVLALVGVSTLALVSAPPASATVHEIVGQWCSGQDALAPPGISGGSSADNFAKPLNANKFIDGIVPHADGFRVNFVYDHPASKVVGTGVFIPIGSVGEAPLYLELIAPDPDFPAFRHCPRLATG